MTAPRTASDRRYTLRCKLNEDHSTLEELLRLPAYQDKEKSLSQRRHLLESDISVLRESGEDLRVRLGAHNEEIYWIDNSHKITINGAPPDLSILYNLLAENGKSAEAEYASAALQILLSASNLTEKNTAYRIHLPRGKYILEIATAIARRQRISIKYAAAYNSRFTQQIIEPVRIEAHYDAFYVLAYKIDKSAAENPPLRTYKIDRILEKPQLLADSATNTANFGSEKSHSTNSELEIINGFSTYDFQVRVKKSRALPLRELAAKVTSAPAAKDGNAQEDLHIYQMQKEDMYEYLVFYGRDAQLLAPREIRQDFYERLQHLQRLVKGGEVFTAAPCNLTNSTESNSVPSSAAPKSATLSATPKTALKTTPSTASISQSAPFPPRPDSKKGDISLARKLSILYYLQEKATSVTLQELADHYQISCEKMHKELRELSTVEITQAGGYCSIVDLQISDVENARPDCRIRLLESPERTDISLNLVQLITLVAVIDYLVNLIDPAAVPSLFHLRNLLTSSAATHGYGSAMWRPPQITGNREVYKVLEAAINNRQEIHFTYWKTHSSGYATSKEVSGFPIQIQVKDVPLLQVYTEGSCRNYRLDRISQAKMGRASLSKRQYAEIKTQFRRTPLQFHTGQLRLYGQGSIKWVAEQIPQAVLLDNKQETVLELPFANLQWVAELLIRLGDGVEKITTTTSLLPLAEKAAALLDIYEESEA